MAHDVYYPYAVDLNGSLVDNVLDQAIDPGVSLVRPIVDGGVDPRAAFVGIADPTININTHQIAAALAALTFDGMKLGAAAIATLFMQKGADGGTRAGALSHMKLECKAGIVIPMTASAGVDETPGTLAFAIHAMDDLTNDPFIFTASQSLAGTPDPDERFWAGPVKLNNVAVNGVQNITVNFGISLRKRRAAGAINPTHISIESRLSQISIVTDDAALIDTYKVPVAIASSTLAYFRKGAVGSRVADVTAEHIKFTAAEGVIVSRGVSGSNQVSAIDIIPQYDGTNDLIAIDAASAIT